MRFKYVVNAVLCLLNENINCQSSVTINQTFFLKLGKGDFFNQSGSTNGHFTSFLERFELSTLRI